MMEAMKTKALLLIWVVGWVTPMAVLAGGGVVTCVGDSITYGSGTTDPSRESWPMQLQGMLQQLDPSWKVLNFGVGGTTLLHQGDKPYIKEGAYQGALTSNPDVVIIKLGTNDSKPQNWVYKAAFVPDYLAMIDAFRALPGRPQVWICKPVPAFYLNFGITPAVIEGEILPLIDEISRKRNVGVIDCFTALTGHGSLFSDGIHPNAEGARLIAQAVFPYVATRRFVRDFTQDGVVNWLDFASLAQHWREANAPLDMDIAPPVGDGVVTVPDLMEWSIYWMAYPGLVAHWPLDEAAGDQAADSLGHFPGTLHGSPEWQSEAGVIGGALRLDGVDDFVSAGPVIRPADGPFTVSAWVRGGKAGQTILSQLDQTGKGVTWLDLDSATGAPRTALTDNGRFTRPLVANRTILDGAWHSVRLVWDGARRYLYVDDQEAAVDPRALGPLVTSGGGIYLGVGEGFKPATFWSGTVDDVRFYSRALRP
jgi:lysophospholipase L1-like esterase